MTDKALHTERQSNMEVLALYANIKFILGDQHHMIGCSFNFISSLDKWIHLDFGNNLHNQ